jgi:hypothetical protein
MSWKVVFNYHFYHVPMDILDRHATCFALVLMMVIVYPLNYLVCTIQGFTTIFDFLYIYDELDCAFRIIYSHHVVVWVCFNTKRFPRTDPLCV